MTGFYATCLLSVWRIFCCSSVLILHSICSQASLQKKSHPTVCVRGGISSNGVMFFATFLFSLSRKEGRKAKTSCFYISLLSPYFSFQLLLLVFHHYTTQNVLRSELSVLLFSVLHTGFATESTAHHINVTTRGSNLLRNQWASSHVFFFLCFDCLVLLVYIPGECIQDERSLLARRGLPLLTLKKSHQSITTVNLQVQLVAAASDFFHK